MAKKLTTSENRILEEILSLLQNVEDSESKIEILRKAMFEAMLENKFEQMANRTQN